MNKPTSDPAADVNVEIAPETATSDKDAWVTPVVREYDPAEVTKAAPIGIGGDLGLYS